MDLTADVYDQLLLLPSCGLRWYCDGCDKAIANPDHEDKIDKLVSVVEKLVEKFVDVEAKLQEKCDHSTVKQLDTQIKCLEENFHRQETDLEKRLAMIDGKFTKHVQDKLHEFEEHMKEQRLSATIPVPIAEKENTVSDEELIKFVVQEKLSKKTAEEQDLENRKRNIIIYRVLEKKTENASERKTNDTVFVSDLLDGVFNMKVDGNDIEKMYRLGRWSEDKSRPLLVAFRNVEQKEYITANLSNLRQPIEKFRGIGISHDLHPREREEIKLTVDKAKHDHINNGGDAVENYKFIVVGKGQRRKAIKIQRKN